MVGNLVGKLPPSDVMLVRIRSSRFSRVLFLVTLSPYFSADGILISQLDYCNKNDYIDSFSRNSF